MPPSRAIESGRPFQPLTRFRTMPHKKLEGACTKVTLLQRVVFNPKSCHTVMTSDRTASSHNHRQRKMKIFFFFADEPSIGVLHSTRTLFLLYMNALFYLEYF
jgi:hypothetical protein